MRDRLRGDEGAGAHALQAVDDDPVAGLQPVVTTLRPSAQSPSSTWR